MANKPNTRTAAAELERKTNDPKTEPAKKTMPAKGKNTAKK